MYDYISIAGSINVCEKYIITDAFKQLTCKIESENLRGPKGCGKSLNLVALLNHIHFKKSVIYYCENFKIVHQGWKCELLLENHFEKNWTRFQTFTVFVWFCKLFLYNFVKNFCANNTLYFVQYGLLRLTYLMWC